MHCFSFDIETVPDVEFGRRMWNLDDVSDEDVASAMTFKQLQKTGNDFLPLHQHRIVAISVALRTGDNFRVWSLGDEDSGEAELVKRFYDGIDRYTPDLVSWNGSGFDLPVLHYRALRHGVQVLIYRFCTTVRFDTVCRQRAIGKSANMIGTSSGIITRVASTGAMSI